jgi:PAS domain S-box-containing protein
MMRATIRQQTLLLAILPMFLAVILLDTYFLYARFSSMEAGMVERAELLSKQIGSSSEYSLFSGNLDQLQDEATAAMKQKDVAAVAIQDVSGKLVAYAGEVISVADQAALDEQGISIVSRDTPNYFWVRESIVSFAIDLGELDTINDKAASKLLGHVLVKMSKTSLQKEKWNVLKASSLISLVLISLTVFIVLAVSRRIINPINDLNQMVRALGDGALDMRISPLPVIRELNELALGVNEMAQRLQVDRAALEVKTELLRASEDRLNEIIDMMPVSLFIKDAFSRITLMNSACEAQWGVLFADVIGTDAGQFFPPVQMVEFLKKDQEVFAGRKMIDFEEVVWNSEVKENRTLHTFKKPIYDKKGQPLYLLGISIDISERKLADIRLNQLNEQLEGRIEEATRELRLKKDEAVNASSDKTRFLAAASHDLRQPMHALGLFVGELHSKLSTQEQRQIVAKVEESVEALSNLLDALLDISKLDAGVVTANVSSFSIEGLLDRLAKDYTPLAAGKGITLRVISNSSTVNSDPILLERLLINLISNAIRYTPIGGRVLVACRLRGGRLRIEVRDSGIGIPIEDQEKIFREFIQLANQERDRSKGLGLGLAIVDRISKLLGCQIDLSSRVNRGATFAVYVPRITQPKAGLGNNAFVEVVASASLQSVAGGLGGLDVLVIDDDALVRKSTEGIIHSWGCHVSLASSLREVKEIHSKADFDLVICDYRLPDGDGVEMHDWIRANFKTQPLYILISGDTSPDILQRVSERGINLLHKPVRPAKLRSLIQYLLNQKTEV